MSNSFPRNALVRYQLASAYLLSANNASEANVRNAIESAENRLSDAIKLDPKLEPAVLLFAELKIRKGSAAAAIEPLRELIKERPQTAQTYYLLATAYLAQRTNRRSRVNLSADGWRYFQRIRSRRFFWVTSFLHKVSKQKPERHSNNPP